MAENNKATFGVVEGVLVYAKLAEADFKYQSTVDKEYSIAVIVDEDTADKWDEEFKKQPSKKVKAAEFEAKYKIPLPEQFEGQKNVYEIKLKKDATKNGEPFFPEYRPKVLLEGEDGERTDITESRLIANGGFGKVSYRKTSNSYGDFAKLNNVLILEKDFVEYVPKASGGVGSEFGEAKPVKVEAAKESATKARASKVKQSPVEDEDSSDQAPF